MNENGLVYVFEGDGKGKTSAALGTALRMLLLEKRVVWISWFKTDKWQISESKLPLYFKNNLKMYWTGGGFFIKDGMVEKRGAEQIKAARTHEVMVYDTVTPENHKQLAEKALILAEEVLSGKNPPDLLVLDESIQAVNENLLTEEALLTLVEKRGRTHLVLTGHVCPSKLKLKADLVTEMKKTKHPYDKGLLAVRGLDF